MEMKENIRKEISVIPRQQIHHVSRKTFSRCETCTDAEGWHFEILL
jgi:hypothetical protein